MLISRALRFLYLDINLVHQNHSLESLQFSTELSKKRQKLAQVTGKNKRLTAIEVGGCQGAARGAAFPSNTCCRWLLGEGETFAYSAYGFSLVRSTLEIDDFARGKRTDNTKAGFVSHIVGEITDRSATMLAIVIGNAFGFLVGLLFYGCKDAFSFTELGFMCAGYVFHQLLDLLVDYPVAQVTGLLMFAIHEIHCLIGLIVGCAVGCYRASQPFVFDGKDFTDTPKFIESMQKHLEKRLQLENFNFNAVSLEKNNCREITFKVDDLDNFTFTQYRKKSFFGSNFYPSNRAAIKAYQKEMQFKSADEKLMLIPVIVRNHMQWVIANQTDSTDQH